ncbi:MAG: hypothetical protein RQ842_11285 [Vulcanisaeta sp.]|nr:hypothetical protein [Vulcanisaeta sp.]
MRKIPIHNENRPIITEARSTQKAPSWSPPNQPIFTLKDYQQLFGNLPTTPFNQLTFYYNKDNKESEKQETSPPIISTNPPTHNTNNLPTYNINSSIGTTIIPSPSPTTNPSITFGNVSLPLWLWRELYQQFSPLPKPSTQEQKTSPPASILKDLRQLLDHLPKTPLPRLPEAEPREAPFPKPSTRGQEPEPIASIPVPIWKMQSLVHIGRVPNPYPPNRPIGIEIQPTHQIPLMLPPTREPEHELTAIVPRDLQQLLNQLPIELRDLLQNAKFITTMPITNPPREPIVNPPIPITPLPIIRPYEGESEREQITSLPIELPNSTPPIVFTPRDLLQPLTYFLAQEQELRPPTFTPQELLQAHLTY